MRLLLGLFGNDKDASGQFDSITVPCLHQVLMTAEAGYGEEKSHHRCCSAGGNWGNQFCYGDRMQR
jgi:hypothetical protein